MKLIVTLHNKKEFLFRLKYLASFSAQRASSTMHTLSLVKHKYISTHSQEQTEVEQSLFKH